MMWKCGVFENQNQESLAALTDLFRETGLRAEPVPGHPGLFAAAVFLPGLPALPGREVCCEAAAVPGSPTVPLRGLLAGRTVTYGFSPKDTLTVSSLEGPPLLSLQREILTLNGAHIPVCELKFEKNFPVTERVLGAVAGLLLCGVPPETLQQLDLGPLE